MSINKLSYTKIYKYQQKSSDVLFEFILRNTYRKKKLAKNHNMVIIILQKIRQKA